MRIFIITWINGKPYHTKCDGCESKHLGQEGLLQSPYSFAKKKKKKTSLTSGKTRSRDTFLTPPYFNWSSVDQLKYGGVRNVPIVEDRLSICVTQVRNFLHDCHLKQTVDFLYC